MDFLNAVILGFVQGLTEFLPISSSAHLRILGEFLPGAKDPGAAFTAITQLGTETAVLVFFWRDIVRIVSRWAKSLVGRVPRNDPDARMGWLIIIGSLPIIVLGLIFQDAIETTLRSLWIVAATLIIFGILLGIADYVGAKRRRLKDITVPHGIIFGFAQALALIPGVSRSGGTITAGLFMGYERPAAARYSFLLAIPAVFGSGLFQVRGGGDARRDGHRLRRGARRDRVLHELHLPAQLPAVRDLPDRTGRAADRAAVDGRHRRLSPSSGDRGGRGST
jgi:undecaprenyl-diphosphatase